MARVGRAGAAAAAASTEREAGEHQRNGFSGPQAGRSPADRVPGRRVRGSRNREEIFSNEAARGVH